MLLWRVMAIALAAGGLAGCSSVFDAIQSDSTASAEPQPPIVSDRFLLADDQQIVGELQTIVARDEDTFVDIARAYNLGFDELVEANPDVDPWLPGAGTSIILPTRFVLPDGPREGIVINIASKRLFYYLEPDEDGARAVVTYPIGIGRSDAATPLGSTVVTSRGRDPVWFPPASIRKEYAAAGNPLPSQVPPGPDNPLGRHVLVLGMPSYLIHGTNRPAGVGMRVSHGCIRLFPENIEFLYDFAPVGTAVTILNQPWLLGWEDGELYLEAHPPLEDDERDWDQLLPGLLEKALAEVPGAQSDDERIAVVTARSLGVPLAVTAGSPAPDTVIGSAYRVVNLASPLQQVTELVARDQED